MKRKVLWLIALVIISITLAACSDEKAKGSESEGNAKDEEQDQETESEASTIPEAALSMDKTLKQEQGIMVEELLHKKQSMDEDAFEKYYEETFKPKMEKEVATYVKEHPKATADEVYDYLVYLLGSGRYGEGAEQAKSYTPKFEEPDFPTGTDTVTTVDGEAVEKTSNAVLLIDASGSMKAKIGGKTQMALAKEAIGKFAEGLPDDGNVSLVVYGHVGTGSDADKKKSCSAIETMYKLDNYNAKKFSKALDSFSASGWTPLAGAINKAKEILKPYQGKKYKNTVYIVSDGVETCGGDPVKAAKKLAESDIQAKVNIIGFDVDNKGQRQLKNVAEAGNGEYATVRSKEELSQQITEEWSPSLTSIAWIHKEKVGPWEEMDEENRMAKKLSKFRNASRNEHMRLNDAARSLVMKDFSKSDRLGKVKDLKESMFEMRQEYMRKISEKNKAKIEVEIERIDKLVDEWKAQWGD